jgi:predicted RNA methylase
MRTIAARLVGSLRNRGFIATISRAWSSLDEWLFDWRYGTDTVSFVKLRPESISSSNASEGVDYEPTRILPLRKVLAAMKPNSDSILVDYGCGKGRVLLVSAECGFRRSVGIEFMPDLCKVARLNVARYREKTGSKADIQIVEADAAEYEVKDDQTHFYFFNPFHAGVLRRVLQRITQSLKRIPRVVYIIYNFPQHGEVVEAFGFRPVKQFMGKEVVIYSNASSSLSS